MYMFKISSFNETPYIVRTPHIEVKLIRIKSVRDFNDNGTVLAISFPARPLLIFSD